MEDVSYEPFPQEKWNEDTGTYTCYGIRAVGPGGTCLLAVEDVTLDLSEAQTLAKACTDGRLDPVHLVDVVLDWIS